MFFKNYIEKKSPEKCPDNDGHNVDAIDALMTVPVTTIAMIEKDRDTRLEAVKNAIQATRRTTGTYSLTHPSAVRLYSYSLSIHLCYSCTKMRLRVFRHAIHDY